MGINKEIMMMVIFTVLVAIAAKVSWEIADSLGNIPILSELIIITLFVFGIFISMRVTDVIYTRIK